MKAVGTEIPQLARLQPCCTKDEGVAMQVETSNHPKLLQSQAEVVSVRGKVGAETPAGEYCGDE
ncbi:MAG: hypothetical protein KGZ92_09690 [Firmicutes bacterium]|nr:hypothetical protein [Dethiobacter sp.]MBS3889534.1 hypothetical protein [Bacillota bacterium]MBS4053976.1 hypothetical protein [Thermaerobacter sp.]